MALTLSLVLILGIALAFAVKSRALGAGSGCLAVLFGFFLASTALAGPVRQVVTALAQALTSIHV